MANRGAGDTMLSSTATVILFFVITTTGVIVAVDMSECTFSSYSVHIDACMT